MTIRERIARLREQAGGQTELARKLRVTAATLSRWENGHFRPNAKNLEDIEAIESEIGSRYVYQDVIDYLLSLERGYTPEVEDIEIAEGNWIEAYGEKGTAHKIRDMAKVEFEQFCDWLAENWKEK